MDTLEAPNMVEAFMEFIEKEKAKQANSNAHKNCKHACITGFWTDGYDTQLFYGNEIDEYQNSPHTTLFVFCPICGNLFLDA